MQKPTVGSQAPAVTSTTTVSSTRENQGLEATVHKLKLQWMMAKSEDERRKLSEEIRKLIESK